MKASNIFYAIILFALYFLSQVPINILGFNINPLYYLCSIPIITIWGFPITFSVIFIVFGIIFFITGLRK